MKILVIAPHPDDEVLGCGGTIKKHVEEGDEVSLCIVTKSYRPDWSAAYISDKKEAIARSSKILGIKKIFSLDLPAAKLDTLPQKELNFKIKEAVEKSDPDIIYLPHLGDLHSDHRLASQAALVAARPLGNNIKKILAYETLSETAWGMQPFVPNVYIDISAHLGDKLKAMSCYKSELKPFPHPRSPEAVSALAAVRGAEAGLRTAEAFALIREII